MTQNQIVFLYCSQEDCISISKAIKKQIIGLHLDITAVKTKRSLKKIYIGQRKRTGARLQKGDYIITIDCPVTCLFEKDYEDENLLHFKSLNHFYEWLFEKFGG